MKFILSHQRCGVDCPASNSRDSNFEVEVETIEDLERVAREHTHDDGLEPVDLVVSFGSMPYITVYDDYME